jgi:peroxiredoxin
MMRLLLWWVSIAALSAFASGCGDRASGIPHFDRSNSGGYGVPEFKDEAPSNAKVAVGTFPQSFVDCNGATVDLTLYLGKKKVVLVVLRGVPKSEKGEFCPSCIAQAGSLAANSHEFEELSAEVLVVFPGPSERQGEFFQKVVKRTPGEPRWLFRILLDQDCSACTQLGIRDDFAKPSTYILDTQGNVVYAYVGETSTDRPSVKAILDQLKKAK